MSANVATIVLYRDDNNCPSKIIIIINIQY